LEIGKLSLRDPHEYLLLSIGMQVLDLLA